MSDTQNGQVDGADPLGPESAECEGYRPTRYELLCLARYWAKVKLDIALDWFYYESVATDELQRSSDASIRLGRLAEALGEDAVQKAVAAVEEEERQRMGPELWQIFTCDDPEVRRGVAEETFRKSERLRAKQEDAVNREKAFAYLKESPGEVYIDEAGDLWAFTDRYPRAWGEPEGRLLLRLVAPRGNTVLVPDCWLERPAGWVRPYGL
jgi:hypothetical protein